MSIRPLPDDVVARIKSSAAIVSLAGVVLELLKNSLDARASTIEATVDFARGACSVDDSGCGIAPRDFAENGRLGKLYCTSKHGSDQALFGRNGTFLAQLSALSLLTLTSRHLDYRSHNAITFHHGTVIERQTPSPSHAPLLVPTHGTRVTVRNLFGNLPVRVKQRAAVAEDKIHSDRLWAGLKRDITALLLTWGEPVSLKVRDSQHRVVFSFSPARSESKHRSSAHINRLLSILSQGNYVAVSEWPSWVPISATTSTLVIKGAISLEPAPSKGVQFISIGLQPLSAEAQYNDLYAQVNTLFANSAFGTVEETPNADERVHHPPKARKGVDRYPMFCLQISSGSNSTSNDVDHLIHDQTDLQAVVEVLAAMITQWLAAHHFRPQMPHNSNSRTCSLPSKRTLSEPNRSSPISSAALLHGRPNKKSSTDASVGSAWRPELQRSSSKRIDSKRSDSSARKGVFAQWSRVKSGRGDLQNTISSVSKRATELDTNPSSVAAADTSSLSSGAVLAAEYGPFYNNTDGCDKNSNTSPENDGVHDDSPDDGTVLWTDPYTKKNNLVNARTGCQIPQPPSSAPIDTHSAARSFANKRLTTSVRLKPSSMPRENSPWLDGILKSWDNPIFQSCETSIAQGNTSDLSFDQQGCQHSSLDHQDANRRNIAGSSSVLTSCKLSKSDLTNAEVIAQVDRKFILIKVQRSQDLDTTHIVPVTMLVLVDQHAADERIQVEDLLHKLCLSSQNRSLTSSKLGHRALVDCVLMENSTKFAISRQERKLLTTFASRFAAWGILFDFVQSHMPNEDEATENEHSLLNVTHLPPAISARCSADPKVLMNFLRSTVWTYSNDSGPTVANTETSDWVMKLANCPPGLVDLVNSRACRSAIMFNDELSLEQCKSLVHNLSACRFPFVCAHGRPSMIPLLDIGQLRRSMGSGDRSDTEKVDFTQAWNKWKGTLPTK